jgi:hypothetical protein
MRLYRGENFQFPAYHANFLLTKRFDRGLDWWNPVFPPPRRKRSIWPYLLEQETVYQRKMVGFEEAIRVWKCDDDKEVRGRFDPSQVRREAMLGQKLYIWHTRHNDRMLKRYWNDMERPTFERYGDEIEKTAFTRSNQTDRDGRKRRVSLHLENDV